MWRKLILATLRMYGRALQEGWRGFRRNWWAAFIPVLYMVILSLVGMIAYPLFGPLAGGFVLGMVSALCVSNYLSIVSASVQGERVLLRELWPLTLELFGPVLSVLFLFWIVSLVLSTVTLPEESRWMLGIVSLAMVVLFNPIAEVTYQRGGDVIGNFAESLQFMKENIVEWSVPFALPFLPFILAHPQAFLLRLAGLDLMSMGTFFVTSFLAVGHQIVGWWLAYIVALVLTFYMMIFRGSLYRALSTSTRRKRIYGEQFR